MSGRLQASPASHEGTGFGRTACAFSRSTGEALLRVGASSAQATRRLSSNSDSRNHSNMNPDGQKIRAPIQIECGGMARQQMRTREEALERHTALPRRLPVKILK
jgi:hypothetical protein